MAGVRTVGIDLAAQSRKTAVCAIDWLDGDVRVTTPAAGYADPELLDCIDDAEAVGIDAPFGWPDFITGNLELYAESGTWPLRPDDRPVKEWAETLL